MRRHGWALYLGLLAGAPAVAQPPADGERSPPPSDLPGIVVSRPRGSPPVVAVAPVATRPASLRLPDPENMARLPDTEPAPYSTTATATVAPIEAAPARPVMAPPTAGCPAQANGATCGAGHGSIVDWLMFRSQSRQSGHYKPRYAPPLFTWFPCDPRNNGYGPRVMTPCGIGCATPFGPMVGPAPVAGPMDGPAPTSPPVAGAHPACPDKDALTSFEKIGDGLGFAPGAAPMASPTTQVKPSTWRPR